MVTADVFLLPCLQSHICIWFWILGGITIRCFITFSLISSMMWYFDRILFWDVKHHFTCCKCCSFTVVSDIQLSNPARVSVHICSVRTSLIACQFTLYLYKRLLRYIFSSLLFCCRLRILFYFPFTYIQTGVRILVVVIIRFQLLCPLAFFRFLLVLITFREFQIQSFI